MGDPTPGLSVIQPTRVLPRNDYTHHIAVGRCDCGTEIRAEYKKCVRCHISEKNKERNVNHS